ncbi:MAG: APC family permease, partial [Gemmatimonadetes bacterium]|nr:APC family permease [Gemmatimonadota bacterium]
FPFGGGGYTVATELLGPGFGVVSGAALLVDYVLTISVSIASAGDQLFSLAPVHVLPLKLPLELLAVGLLVLLTLRGVKESVLVLAPIFGLFNVTHVALVFGGIGAHLDQLPRVAADVSHGFHTGLGTLGAAGMFGLFLSAYSMGGGTYTGIEAVSNGVPIMREPKVETARRTMRYIAVSLALTAGGLLLLYLLYDVRPEPGKTLNAVLAGRFAGGWTVGGLGLGHGFVAITLFAEAALLFVAAQAGFLDGPRVMANMARDHWLPHRFVQLSERLTVQDGVLLMGGAALATLLYARGNITVLVTMYAINIFVTFSLSQLAMVRHWLAVRRTRRDALSGLAINGSALILCVAILTGTLYEKFERGGWVTLVATSSVVALCFAIRRHYRDVLRRLRSLDELLPVLALHRADDAAPPDTRRPTAVLFVSGFGGLGVHSLLTVLRLFPGHFANVVFVSVGVIDAAVMKGVGEVERLRAETEASLQKYVELAGRLGLSADTRLIMATETMDAGEQVAREVVRRYPRSIFFLGRLIFEREPWFGRILHNQTAYRLQRRLQFAGMNAMVLPVRVLDRETRAPALVAAPAGGHA